MITETRKVPASALRLRGDFMQLRFAAADAEVEGQKPDGRRRFHMVANTGKPMQLGYWGRFVIDFTGLRFKQRIAVLADHLVDQRIGFTEKLEVTDEGLVAEGTMLRNEKAAAILKDADDGFPWQASLWLEPESVLVLGEGETANVNGQVVEGPCYVAKAGTVREVSFVALGADDDAYAEAKASGAAEVEIQILREETMTKPATAAAEPMTAAQLQKDHPTLLAEITADAIKAALAAERERVASILDACDDGQLKLGAQLLKAGVSASEGIAKINEDLRGQMKLARAGTLKGPQSTQSLADGNGGVDADLDPEGKVRAQFPQDERGQKAYDAWRAKRGARAS